MLTWTRERVEAVLYYSGSCVVCQGLRLFGLLVAALHVPAKEFGIYATGLMLVGLCNMLRDLGQDPALLSLPVLNHRYIRLHFLGSSILGVIGATVLVGAIWLTPWFVDLRAYLPALLVLLILEATWHTPLIVAQRRFRFRSLAIVEIVAISNWVFAIILFALWRADAATLFLAASVESVSRWVGLFRVESGCVVPARIPKRVWRYFISYAKILTAQSWIQHFSEHVDVALMRALAGPVELGAYARMKQILGVTFSLSVRLVDKVASATYSAEQQSIDHLRRSTMQFLLLMLTGAAFALAGTYAFLTWFAADYFGPQSQAQILQLWWWAIPFCVLRPLMWNFNLSFQSTSRPRLFLFSVLAHTLLLVGSAVLLLPLLGARGLFLALALSTATTVLLQYSFAKEFSRRDSSRDPLMDRGEIALNPR